MHVVLKPFPCSFDGITSVMLEVGDVRDFGSLAPGLVAEKYIESARAEPVIDPGRQEPRPIKADPEPPATLAPTAVNDPDPDTVEIPADWRDLSGNKLRSLAALVSPTPITSKATAITAIEAELARRAG